METTQQVKTPPNPTGKGGFGDNPENRNPGGWKKEESISYQYNKLMRMSLTELEEFVPETVAQQLALNRIKEAKTSLADIKEITDRTEGKPVQAIDMSMMGEVKRTADKIKDFLDDTDDAGSEPTPADSSGAGDEVAQATPDIP